MIQTLTLRGSKVQQKDMERQSIDRASSRYFFVSLVLIFHHYIFSACGSWLLPFFDVHFISLLFSCPLTSLYFPLSVPSALIFISITPYHSTFFLLFSQRNTAAELKKKFNCTDINSLVCCVIEYRQNSICERFRFVEQLLLKDDIRKIYFY